MPKVGGLQPSNHHNKQKSCDLLISHKLLASPSFPLKIFPEVGHYFVIPSNIQMGEGYRKNSKIRLLPLITQCSFHASVSSLNILLGYIENLKALKLDLKTLTILTRKPRKGFLIFIIYLPQ